MRRMDWLTNTRTSYATVATGYAARMRDSLTEKPYVRGMVTLFADLVRRAVTARWRTLAAAPAM